MAEETTATQDAPVQQAPTTFASQATNVLSAIGDFIPPEMREQIEALSGGNQPPTAAQPAPANATAAKPDENRPATPAAEGEKGEPNTPAPPAEGQPAEGQPAAPAKKSILGTKKKFEPAKPDIIIEKPEDVLGVIKSKFGQEYKDFKETPKFFESAQGWRKDSEKLKTVETELTQIQQEVSSLPAEFHEAFKLYANGQDYRQAFTKKATIDLTKPVDKLDEKELVNNYFPGKFTDDDFKESPEERSGELKMALEAAKTKFELEKRSHEEKGAKATENAKRIAESQKQAVKGSLNTLKERFPDMEEINYKEVESAMEGGIPKVLSFFYNNDGTAKPDAAVRFFMALKHEDIISELTDRISNAVETEKNIELLTRGADGPKPNRSSGSPEQLPDSLKKQIEEIKAVGDATTRRTF